MYLRGGGVGGINGGYIREQDFFFRHTRHGYNLMFNNYILDTIVAKKIKTCHCFTVTEPTEFQSNNIHGK